MLIANKQMKFSSFYEKLGEKFQSWNENSDYPKSDARINIGQVK